MTTTEACAGAQLWVVSVYLRRPSEVQWQVERKLLPGAEDVGLLRSSAHASPHGRTDLPKLGPELGAAISGVSVAVSRGQDPSDGPQPV
mmetsp:Transcript_82027/g.137104  ORF Transcript_82027/g.137104 Transcript_82027/m.137104 type:complete len:89 (+) Transcript_82027:214-480(+)|eukprot:CAMPEP_0174366922 /NCGR_PEP_ID=MMETSP0811_2-20130205/83153_1 /TAXON_ID=73025 ORGANISM="Eutreptiella gymnastica-like, Strain CCMP1594" /NCGR_SAMPLE_ID=MMETSP0811_2 /ASSEMBLY_ACC=CAM_ASM_000667 /LENGTH=88 /DNA_ID=CAMNT_0015508963 /DNA_START=223 /DNA_END=489 /DNA_ORIENTATION=-